MGKSYRISSSNMATSVYWLRDSKWVIYFFEFSNKWLAFDAMVIRRRLMNTQDTLKVMTFKEV